MLFPDICLMRDQSSEELVEWEQDSTFSIQVSRLCWAIEEAICASKDEIRGFDGF